MLAGESELYLHRLAIPGPYPCELPDDVCFSNGLAAFRLVRSFTHNGPEAGVVYDQYDVGLVDSGHAQTAVSSIA